MKITRFAVTAMVLAVLTMLATGLANAQPPKCSTSITSCGCTIGTPGEYTVENILYASQGLTLKGGCIDIEGSNINLYVDYNINGPGSNSNCNSGTPHLNSGVGIHVLPTASNVSIDDENYVCGWSYGIESEGNNINFYDLDNDYDTVGLFLNNATNNTCLYCYTYYNVIGTQITGGSGNSVGGGESYYNSKFGYWVDGSKGNTLSNDYAKYDGTGFYLGCSSSGAVNPTILCNKNTPTTKNNLLDNEAEHNSKYGIATERGSIYNNFNGNDLYSNGPEDIIDGNGNCVYNGYLNNSFSTASPNCIQ